MRRGRSARGARHRGQPRHRAWRSPTGCARTGGGWRGAERSTGVDLSDFDAARQAVERLERIDALVANAGVIVRCGVLELSLEDWQHVIDVDLTSVFVLAQAAARRMVEGGGGAIVLLASQLSFFGGFNVAADAAAKGGVAQLTKALSNELAGRGLRVNAVAPGSSRRT